jgi:hypothetical protein
MTARTFFSWSPPAVALNGLMAELVEGHIWFHVLDPNGPKDSPQAAAAEELIDIGLRHRRRISDFPRSD